MHPCMQIQYCHCNKRGTQRRTIEMGLPVGRYLGRRTNSNGGIGQAVLTVQQAHCGLSVLHSWASDERKTLVLQEQSYDQVCTPARKQQCTFCSALNFQISSVALEASAGVHGRTWLPSGYFLRSAPDLNSATSTHTASGSSSCSCCVTLGTCCCLHSNAQISLAVLEQDCLRCTHRSR